MVDINSDGLLDIVLSGSYGYDNWSLGVYVQTSKEVFKADDTMFKYSVNGIVSGASWKPWLIHHDFNKYSIKDFSYIDPHNYLNNSLHTKSVFIKMGNVYEEQDFYQFDIFANIIKP